MFFAFDREDLIDSKIERAVSRMQSVIELGRYLRDRNTIPSKYPLKEVVVIHPEQECMQDVRSLEKYILEVCHEFPSLLHPPLFLPSQGS